MTDNIYFKRPIEFKAIQFTGGEENGKAVIEWLHENVPGSIGNWQKHSPATIGGDEWINCGRHTLRPGSWATVDSYHQELRTFFDDEFQKLFVLTQEFTEESFHGEAAEENVPANVDGFQGELTNLINKYSLESDTGTPDFILAKFAIHTLIGLTDFVHERAQFRAEKWWDEAGETLKTNSAYGKMTPATEDAVISNGIIDNVPGIDPKLERFDENTLVKVRASLMSGGMDSNTAQAVIINIMNAGILFRERV